MAFIELNPHECRVLGVLVEKALATPAQYPLTLNAIVTGSNQKNNRSPVLNLDEDDVLTAIDGLRAKQLAREVMMSGSRVAKYRHLGREGLALDTPDLVVMVELLLRGPQSAGEIRGRASRMHPIESLEVLAGILEALMACDPPLVQRVAPAPGSRATRYAQLLCPTLHPLDAAPAPTAPTASAAPAQVSASPRHDDRVDRLEARLDAIEAAVARIEAALDNVAG